MASAPLWISSVLMNEGANVLEVGLLFFELERFRVPLVLGAITPPMEENDCCRMWVGDCEADNGGERITDLGLPGADPGAGDWEPVLEKGLLRLCAGLEAIVVDVACAFDRLGSGRD